MVEDTLNKLADKIEDIAKKARNYIPHIQECNTMPSVCSRLNNRNEFYSLVGSRFFTVTFKKKGGEVRTMLARCGVKKHLKGTGKHIDDGRIVVWEPASFNPEEDKAGYKTFWPEQVIAVKVRGTTYEFTHEGNQ